MKYLFGFLGFIIALPILLTLVVLVVISLIGGYVATIAYFCWWIIGLILLAWVIVRVVKRFT